MSFIIAVNKANGIESKYTQEEWEKLPKKHKKIFNVKNVPAPQEVVEKEAQEQATETAQKSTQVENEATDNKNKKNSVKTKETNTGNQK